ncbi:MAG: RsbRD N-terminal domain-containing protein [Acidobacteriota bacterium]
MAASVDTPLMTALAAHKSSVINKWLERTFQAYLESTNRFFPHEKDPFCSPVDRTLREGLSSLFLGLTRGLNVAALAPDLYGIVRIGAVHDMSASQAVGFVFILKHVIREELETDAKCISQWTTDLDARIDEMALLAFDIFMRVRQQICEMRVSEVRRMTSLLEQEHWQVEEETIG